MEFLKEIKEIITDVRACLGKVQAQIEKELSVSKRDQATLSHLYKTQTQLLEILDKRHTELSSLFEKSFSKRIFFVILR